MGSSTKNTFVVPKKSSAASEEPLRPWLSSSTLDRGARRRARTPARRARSHSAGGRGAYILGAGAAPPPPESTASEATTHSAITSAKATAVLCICAAPGTPGPERRGADIVVHDDNAEQQLLETSRSPSSLSLEASRATRSRPCWACRSLFVYVHNMRVDGWGEARARHAAVRGRNMGRIGPASEWIGRVGFIPSSRCPWRCSAPWRRRSCPPPARAPAA